VVVATGDTTVFGQIAKLTGKPKKGLTTMEKDILRFVVLIFIIMMTWIVIVVAVWYVVLWSPTINLGNRFTVTN